MEVVAAGILLEGAVDGVEAERAVVGSGLVLEVVPCHDEITLCCESVEIRPLKPIEDGPESVET